MDLQLQICIFKRPHLLFFYPSNLFLHISTFTRVADCIFHQPDLFGSISLDLHLISGPKSHTEVYCLIFFSMFCLVHTIYIHLVQLFVSGPKDTLNNYKLQRLESLWTSNLGLQIYSMIFIPSVMCSTQIYIHLVQFFIIKVYIKRHRGIYVRYRIKKH